ncbi:dimethyl sulfoxide reductase anchor subunit family protein [Streptomyces sp. BI20]|uniref:dimethyl sulfoxide reductase anchor subunit family protein n=1 Tax=Streptomyces sp. BI20 TaxID=3403460 RepID=UPI003C72C82B
MYVHELPMIAFTVLAQMSVGAFVVVCAVRLLARVKGGHDRAAIDRLTHPGVYAALAGLGLGMFASIFHMNDIGNVLNVFRHVGSSWLSREIVMGVVFGGLLFLYAASAWFDRGGVLARRILAVVTALAGLGLVWSMSMIYYTLPVVPAWHTWRTPAFFLTTTFLLGSLAAATAFAAPALLRRVRGAAPEGTSTPLLRSALTGTSLTAIAFLGVESVLIPLHLTALADGGPAAAASAGVFSGAWFIARLLLVFAGAGVLAALLYRHSARRAGCPRRAATLTTAAFTLVLVGELIGRSQFYESMTRIGM